MADGLSWRNIFRFINEGEQTEKMQIQARIAKISPSDVALKILTDWPDEIEGIEIVKSVPI
jgi:hypothetical protein